MTSVSVTTSPGRAPQFWLPVAVSIVIGLAEWSVLRRMGSGLGQGEASRALLAITGAYGVLGLTLGGVAALLGRKGHSASVAAALPPAVLLGLAVLRESRAPVLVVAALAFGWLIYRLFSRVLASRPFLLRPHLWWTIQGIMLAMPLALTAGSAPDAEGLAIAAGVTAAAAVLLIWGMHPRHRVWQPGWRPVLSSGVVLIASWILGTRAPVVVTDETQESERPSVLLITIDTLRADHVGAYGYDKARTPNLDRLAERGVLFREVVAPHVRTGPSHASILTGLLPEAHGVLLNLVRLPPSVTTLADILRAEGYATGAFVSGYTTIDGACGLPSRFDFFDDDLREFRWIPKEAYGVLLLQALQRILKAQGVDFAPMSRPAADTTDSAIAWLAEQGDSPFFIWVHLYDPHLPYRPPQTSLTELDRRYQGPASGQWYALDSVERTAIVSSPDNVDHMIALYDAEIAYADEQVGRLVDAARNAAPGGDLLIVATSDHGESMGEHGLYWTRDLYDPTLLVPLIVVPPEGMGETGRELTTQVRLIDIAPTIVDLLGIEGSWDLDGVSLAASIRGEDGKPSGPAHSAVHFESRFFQRRSISVRNQGWKLIWRAPGWDRSDGGPWAAQSMELYELQNDPREERNVVDAVPAILAELQNHPREERDAVGTVLAILAELEHKLEPRKDVGDRLEVSLTAEELKRLRSLGYFR